MKRVFATLALLAAALPLRAELPPSAYEAMQREASEVLRINVLNVQETASENPAVTDVNVVAEVLKVGRSAAKLNPGDMITITYHIADHPSGWVGPGEIPLLKDMTESIAYLKPVPETNEYTPAAGAMSFSQF